MNKIFSGRRLRIALPLLGVFVSLGVAWVIFVQRADASRDGESGLLEKMVIADGNVVMDIDLNKAGVVKSQPASLRFGISADSFFKTIAFNDEFRGALPGSMMLTSQNTAALPVRLNASLGQLSIVANEPGSDYELSVRDASGYTFFDVEGFIWDYSPAGKGLAITGGRLLLNEQFATELGRRAQPRAVVGSLVMNATLRPIEVTTVVNSEVQETTLPPTVSPEAGTVPGPDVTVGDLVSLSQFGNAGTRVGLAVGTDSCNYGTQDLHWFANPANDHPVIPQNLYRMSGGADNTQTMEQVGQSSVKHAFTALTQNLCALGCNGVGGSNLGSGCSDPYSASLNAGPNLGSRAWINPYTGFYPRNDSATPNNNHSGHSHVGTTHRILVEQADLSTALNPGAKYFAEAQYVTPHEYAWCQSNPTQCNMFNNVSYRQYNVSGTTSFTFSAAGSTVRMKSAIEAWTGATIVPFRPVGTDGMGMVGYKVTNPSPGVWHYEYAVYNMNLDRAIQSFGVPQGSGVTLSNVGFHAPLQQPGSANDGTEGSAGFSNDPWVQSEAGGYVYWSTDTIGVSANANAIRWGTMYNFRFDSNKPPMLTMARLGFFKTGEAVSVLVQAPQGGLPTCSRVPTGNRC